MFFVRIRTIQYKLCITVIFARLSYQRDIPREDSIGSVIIRQRIGAAIALSRLKTPWIIVRVIGNGGPAESSLDAVRVWVWKKKRG